MAYISKEDVIEAIAEYYNDKKYVTRSRSTLSAICIDMKNVVKTLPDADVIERDCVTINGYPVEYLTAVVSLAVANNITPEIAIRQMADLKVTAKILNENMKNITEEALRVIVEEADSE